MSDEYSWCNNSLIDDINTGLHRYVFQVYKQPCKYDFKEPRLTNTSFDGRAKHSAHKFFHKYKMEGPIAANFFQVNFSLFVSDPLVVWY